MKLSAGMTTTLNTEHTQVASPVLSSDSLLDDLIMMSSYSRKSTISALSPRYHTIGKHQTIDTLTPELHFTNISEESSPVISR